MHLRFSGSGNNQVAQLLSEGFRLNFLANNRGRYFWGKGLKFRPFRSEKALHYPFWLVEICSPTPKIPYSMKLTKNEILKQRKPILSAKKSK